MWFSAVREVTSGESNERGVVPMSGPPTLMKYTGTLLVFDVTVCAEL